MSNQDVMAIDCPVQLACDYGSAHGDGYWIVLTLKNGKVIRGPTYEPEGGIIRVHVYDPPTEDTNAAKKYDPYDEPPTFVRCSDVATASVEF